MINSVKTNSGEKLSISSVANEMAPAGTHLLLRAPKGGTRVTAISSESSLQLTSSSRYLRLWTVRIDHAEDGDCGSWIVDPATGQLLGMLVATCEAVCEAYILPIKDIFKEIENSSGHLAKLPALDLITETKETKTASMEKFDVKTDMTSDPAKDTNLLYRPLQAGNIRVLKLLPGMPGAVIRCEFSIRSLGGPADYESLYYALGSPTPISHIYINGLSIRVTSNLASALDNLRYDDRSRYLWVDSLCIDPENVQERNSQVPLLAPILLSARGVCVWLGMENSESHSVMSSSYDSTLGILRVIHDQIRNAKPIYNLRQDVLRGLVGFIRDSSASDWFPRGAVQAICLAKRATIYCGRDSMPWDFFADTLSAVNHDHELMTRLREERYVIVNMWSECVSNIENSIRRLDDGQIERRSSLESLVMAFSWLETTSAHDCIYSMLSLASDVYPLSKSSVTSSAKDFVDEPPKTAEGFLMPLEGQQKRPFIVDYSQGFGHVCKDVVKLAVQNSQSLDILCIPWAPNVDRLPSWIAVRSQAATLGNSDSKNQGVRGHCFVSDRRGPGILQIYHASGIKPPLVLVSNSSDGSPILKVKGFTVDAVQATTSPALTSRIPPHWTDFLGWKDTDEPPPDKAWRTLVGDRGKDTRCFAPTTYRRDCIRVFNRLDLVSDFPISRVAARYLDSTTQEFAQTVETVVSGRRLIRTEKHGFLGLAPQATQERDIVAILYGLSVPVVLRQIHFTPDGDNVFILIGECFIYGMMDGEALRFKEVHGIQDQTFVLR